MGSAYEPTPFKGLEPDVNEGGKICTCRSSQRLCKSVLLTNSPPDHGSCHCGAVTLAVKVDKPLEDRDITADEERIVECNCSICMRVGFSPLLPNLLPTRNPEQLARQCAWLIPTQGAYIWIYPRIEETAIEGREHLSYRVFNKGVVRKAFCKHCGVHVCNEPNPLTGEQSSSLPGFFFPGPCCDLDPKLAPRCFIHGFPLS